MILIGLGAVPLVGLIAALVLGGAFKFGLFSSFFGIMKGKEIKVGNLFDGFSYFGNSYIAYLLVGLFTLLWTLLLIVPGFIAALRYSMTFFILSETGRSPVPRQYAGVK